MKSMEEDAHNYVMNGDEILNKWSKNSMGKTVEPMHYGDLTSIVGAMVRRAYEAGAKGERRRMIKLLREDK